MMRAKFLTGIFSLLLFVPFMMYGIQTGSDTKIGTNTLSAKTPQVVYASGEEKFLTVWTGNEAGVEHIFCSVHTEATVSGTPSVTGILLSIPAGGNFRYAQFPQVAYNATTGKAAVVWIENYGAGIDYLKMSILDMRTDPVLAPVPIRIDNSDTPKMAVTVQSDQTGNFLVAWYDGSTLNVTGQLYSGSGTPAGGSFIFGQVPVGYLFPYAIDIACNSTNNSFMVVWSDFVASLSACRVVGSAPVLPPVTISDPDGTLNPAIAYNDSLNNFMVVYNTFSHRVRGRIINDSGQFTTDTYTFGNTTDPATDPDIAFNTDNNNFAVSWSSLPGSGIWIQELLIESCDHYSVPVRISDPAPTANAPSITYGSTARNYWVTWFGAPQGKDEIWLQRYSSDFRWVEAHCKDITVYLDGNGSYSLQVTDIDDGSRAVCETPSLSASLSTLSCSHIPSASVTLTAKHSKGFESACQSVVTVLDTISPTVVAQDLTVYLNENGLKTVAASEVDNGSSDACGILTRTLSKTLFGCGDVGPNNVILTVTDKNGNSKRAGVVITVVDNRPPILVMHDFTIGLDIDGAANLLVYDVIEHAYDPCGIASMVLSQSTFDCDDLGPHTVTLTVTDNNGNISTGSAVVTVVDNRPPDVVTQSVTINLNELGVASITAAEVDNGSTDNCGIASMALSRTDFDCQDAGPNTVTLTVTDVNGNSNSAQAVVTVADNILPTVNVRNAEVHIGLDGLARIDPYMIDAGSTDNCGIASMVLDRTTFSCSDVGGQRVTLTVTDVNGNRNSAQAAVFVRDDTAPLITLGKSRFVIDLNEEGLAYMNPGMTNYTVEDGCGPVTVGLSQTIFSCDDVGYNQIAFAAYDRFGNTSIMDIDVIVRESVPPTIVCSGDIIVNRNPNCQYRLRDYTIESDYTATDNCGSFDLTITQSPLPGTFVPIGTTPITLTATDAGRNSSSCTFNLIVEGPAVDFTADQTSVCHETAIAFTGESVEAVDWVWDFGDGSSSTERNPVHTYALPGSYSVSLTITAADGCTNSEVKTNFITVNQPVAAFTANPPTGNSIPHTVFFTDQSTGADGWQWDFGDGGVSTAQNPIHSFTQYGIYMVILTATNSTTGCSDTASVKIEIGDEIPPEITCPGDAIVYTGTGCSGVLPDYTALATVTDNLDPAPVVTQSPLPGTMITADTEVMLTATDYFDNQSFCTFMVTLEDHVPPVVVTKNIVVQLDASGEAMISASAVDNGSSDACGIASMSLSQTIFSCSHVGANTVTLTVTDVNGNSNAATAVVTVEDNVPPEVVTKNIVVQLDASGDAMISASAVDNGSSDACGIASMSLSQMAFDCSHVGANTVTLTVTDVNGNSNAATAEVTVEDNVPPVVVTKDVTIWLNSNGMKTITPAWVDKGSADNCGIATMMLSQTDFDCRDVGMKEITLTVTDVNGNSNSRNAAVMVVDHLSPIAVAKDVTLPLDGNGRATLTAAEVDNYSWDACGIALMSLSQTEFDCTHVGVNTVTLTVTDVNGNTDTDTAVITVEDNTPPLVKTQHVILELDAAGTATVTAGQVDHGSTDHCGIASMSLSPTNFDCSHAGANTVTLTVTDVNGNRSSATATVTVVDNLPPMVVTQPAIIELDAAGRASLTVAQVDNGSVDNCGIASMTLSQTAFDCSHVGENMVTLTVTDIHGNENNAAAIVTVVDRSIPVVLTKDITIQLDTGGNAMVVADAVDNGSSDICGIASMTLSQTAFDCSHVGANTVTLTVTDENGNSNAATAVVTVEDNRVPVVMTKNIVVALDADGQATITATDVDNGSADNCGIASMRLSQTTFDCNQVGENVVTLTVTDYHGNTGSAVTVVTVVDDQSPVVEIQPVTVWLDADGQVEVTPEALIAEAGDNCGIARYELSQSIFDCTHLGLNEVTLWAVDDTGNRTEMATTVLVLDSLAPVVLPRPLTIWLDHQGRYELTYEEIIPMLDDVTDNCTSAGDLPLEITLMNSTALITRFGSMTSGSNPYLRSFSCAQAGQDIPIRFTFTDGSGNRAVTESLITVLDTISPVVQVRELTRIDLDVHGRATLIPMDIITEVWDACGIASMMLDRTTFTCSDQGVQVVQLTVTDHHGNVTLREAQVVTADVIEPVVITRPVTLYLDANGEATLTPAQVDNGSYDNCAVKEMSVSQTLFTKADLGTKPIVFCVSDLRGNSPCALAEVTVVDALPPVLSCKSVELFLDAHGQASLQAGDLVASVSDNVAVASVVASQTQFDCAALGENRVVVTATDSSGNSTHCEAVVTVRDLLPPMIHPVADIVVQVDQLATETAVSYPQIVVTDNCSYTLSQISGRGPAAKFPVGTATEQWRAIDAAGNSVMISFTITVVVVYVNHPPVVQNPVSDVVMEVTELLAFPVRDSVGEVFADPDGDPLTITALLENGDPLPSWISFADDTVRLAPMHADTGCVQIALIATDPSGLSVTDHFTICVKGWPVSVGDFALEPFGVVLYPNPTTGRVQVEIQTGYGTPGALQTGGSDPNKAAFGITGNATQGVLRAPAAGTEDVSLRVFDAGGRLVLTKAYLRDEQVTFDLSGHISGIYYVRIAVDDRAVVRKVQLETKR